MIQERYPKIVNFITPMVALVGCDNFDSNPSFLGNL